jgi:membrane protease YdiL (CAAX protease family)
MFTRIADSGLDRKGTTAQANRFKQIAWFIGLFICTMAVFILPSNLFKVLPTNRSLSFSLSSTAVLLVIALWLKSSKRWSAYWRIAFAFCMACAAYPATSLLANWYQGLLNSYHISITTNQGIALDKLCSVIVMVGTILVLNKLSGADLGSAYLRRGNLKWGLAVGGLIWFNFATSAFLFFATRFSSAEKMIDALLWGLVFSFANGFMEELWLRGILLKRFEPVIGMGGSILLTALVFSSLHAFATYLPSIAVAFYVLNTLTLGLACGYLMMKTNSIWGPVLIHAAADLFLFIATLSAA